MGQITRLNTANPLTQRIWQEVEQRRDRLNQIRDVTTLAIREGVRLQQTVGNMVVTTLAIAQSEIDAARRDGKMTPHKEQALYHYREAYKHELLSIVEDAHTKVYRVLDRLK